MLRCAARGAQANPAFIFKTQTDGTEFTNVGLEEMGKIIKDLAQEHSQEVEEGPQLQASWRRVEHPAASAVTHYICTPHRRLSYGLERI